MLVCFLSVRSFVRACVRLFVYLSFGFVLRSFLVGNTTARVRRNRIYEKTGGKGKEVGRQIGHHRTAKHKESQEATGVQIQAQEATEGKIPAWEAPNPTQKVIFQPRRSQQARIQPQTTQNAQDAPEAARGSW